MLELAKQINEDLRTARAIKQREQGSKKAGYRTIGVPMEFDQLTSDEILCVLERIHKHASDLNEELGVEYNDALVKVFHELWTALNC